MGRLDFDAMCTVRFDWNGHVSKGRVAMAGFSFAYIKKMDNQNRVGGAWQLEIARIYVWVVLQMDVDGWGWVGNVEKRYAAFLVIFLFYNIICIWCFFTCDNNYYLLVSMHWVFNVWIRYMVNPHKLKKGATLLHWREYRWIGLTLLYWRD